MEKPKLNNQLDPRIFRDFYFLKEELVQFCRENGLPVSGGKIEITKRIEMYLATGEIEETNHRIRHKSNIGSITKDTIIEPNFVCSQKHREFFREVIGSRFSFNVLFQKWLKANAGKSYDQAIQAYDQIIEDKKKNTTIIDKQFEYNTYIRDFFEENHAKTLQQAILCWNYKKALQGHNRYEKSDLIALKIK